MALYELPHPYQWQRVTGSLPGMWSIRYAVLGGSSMTLPEPQHECDECGKGLYTKRGLRIHRYQQHGVNYDSISR